MDEYLYFRMDSLPLVSRMAYNMEAVPDVHPERVNPFHVLLYVTKGSFEITIGGVPETICADTLRFIPANTHHYGHTESSPNREWFYVHFYTEKDGAALPIYEVKPQTQIRNHEFQPEDYHYQIKVPLRITDGQHTIRKQLHELLTVYNAGDPFSGARASAALYPMLLNLSIHAMPQESSVTAHSKTVQQIITYLELHDTHPLSTEDLAEHMQMSYKYMSGQFKQQVGMTIYTYHTYLRINNAVRMLRESDLTVSKVGEAVGFQDPSHFSRVFKSVMGISPMRFLQGQMTEQPL